MEALDHITLLRNDTQRLEKHLDDFADEHLNEGWLESAWKRLLHAYRAEEKHAALDELQREYERLKFIKGVEK